MDHRAMRLAAVIAIVGAAACGERPPQPAGPGTPQPAIRQSTGPGTLQPAAAVARSAPAPLELAITDRAGVAGAAGPACQEWQLAPPPPGADDGELVSRTKLDDGDTLVVRYGLSYGPDKDTAVTLLGPSSEVIAPTGRQPRSGGVAFGCGSEYQIVGSAGGVLTILPGSPPLGGRIHAYVDVLRQRVALLFLPHQGC
jgi:hypothetical protein